MEAGDEIVDLTCESLEPVVVDLTHNDSVVVSAGPVALPPVTCVWADGPKGGHVSGKAVSPVGGGPVCPLPFHR